MADSNFNEYLKEVQERDQRIIEETPLPTPKENNVWTLFGLFLGIASIIFSFFLQYDAMLGIFAMGLSVVGYTKKKNNTGLAAIICSGIGICLAIVLTAVHFSMMKNM